MVPFLRYLATALTLKVFSASPALRRVYRILGNKYGQNRHSKVSEVELDRGLWLCQMISDNYSNEHICQTVLELGTGWTHFYAIFLRMFFNVNSILFDVQDNRQFDALKRRVAELSEMLPQKISSGQANNLNSIGRVTETIAQARDFEDLYRLLDMRYMTDPQGQFASIPDNSVDVVFSVDVLEHVFKKALPDTVNNIYRVLRPGGLSAHQIGLDDHLAHYAAGMSAKNYLRYSNATWAVLFENDLQYINRVQLSDFLEIFKAGNLELLHYETEADTNLFAKIAPAAQFRNYDLASLQATRASIVHRKPVSD